MSSVYKIFFTVFSLHMFITGISQSGGEKDIDITEYRPRFISLPPADTKYTPSLPASAIEVFDVRFDTSNIGLLQNSVVGKEKLIHFKKGPANEVKEYYRSAIRLTNADNSLTTFTIACFIKKLFISDNIYIDKGQRASSKDLNFEIRSGAIAMIEFYATRGEGFIPLYRFDSTITGEKDIYHYGQSYISEILLASLRKIGTINWEKISTLSKSKSRTEIDAYNNSRFNIPILTETPRKGIYLSFENFKKNTPLDTAFSVEKTKRGDFLYVKNKKGEDILQTEFWGYSDGKDSYIFSAQNYFKLYRYDNAFMIYGAKDFTSVRKLRLNFGLLDIAMPNSNYAKAKTANSYKLEFSLFQLDMDTGELY
jgi:hypothetical protein